MTLRVTVLTTSYPRHEGDDAGIFVKRLVHAIGATGARCTVVVPQDLTEPVNEHAGPVTVCRFKYGIFSKGHLAFGAGILPNIKAAPALILQAPALILGFVLAIRRIRKETDIIQANWLFSALAAYFAKFLFRIPYAVTVRGEDLKLLADRRIAWAFNEVLRKAVAVITVNRGFAETINQSLHLGSKVICIPNGVEVAAVQEEEREAFRKSEGLEREKCYLLYVGRIIPLKNIEAIIEILAGLPRRFELILCGREDASNYAPNLRSLIKRREMQDRVHFKGLVAPERVSLYLAVARYYVSASTYEGRSNSILEALASRKIVIASKIPAHEELVENGRNGYLFPLEDPAQACQVIQKLESEPALYLSIGNEAESSCRGLSWAKSAEDYLAILNSSHSARNVS